MLARMLQALCLSMLLALDAGLVCGEEKTMKDRTFPNPVASPESPLMLDLHGVGADPERIDFAALGRLEGEHAVVSKADRDWPFRLHSYLVYWQGKYWCMWSHGPVIEDHPRQHVRYATSPDGLNWSEPKVLVGPSPREGFRYIARGFWLRGDGRLRALASHDEALKDGRRAYFGKSLELLSFVWDPEKDQWRDEGVLFDNAISNFPPKKLPSGEWMMSRRDSGRNVSLLIGGIDAINDWQVIPFSDYRLNGGGILEEPCWAVLPDGNIVGLFRDNSRSGRLLRSFSINNGRAWTEPVRTNFPDATSKFNLLRTSRGYYVLVSNANPDGRNPLCLSVSDDGLVFTSMGVLPIPAKPSDSLQYPHIIEEDEHLLVAFSRNKNTIEVVSVPLDGVDRLKEDTRGTRANSVGMNMMPITPGTFRMGSDSGEADEGPVHTVTLTQPLVMSATEVTNAQYEQFDPAHRALRGKRGLSREDDEAVIFVSWHDATAFCKWLSEKEGKPYRLPTEAEWEYACRAGTATAYSTGDELPEVYRKAEEFSWDPTPVDLTVGQTPPNLWGLHDMHGNVEEWCLDWYGPYPAEPQTDPVGYADGLFRVTRGGSHNTTAEFLRSANRLGTLPEDKHWLIGFRVVLARAPRGTPLVSRTARTWQRDVKRTLFDWSENPVGDEPIFLEPIPFMRPPARDSGEPFYPHNHCPSIAWCDNGDLLAVWFSTRSERGREMTILASRLRAGAAQWEPSSEFFKAPDRNMTGSALLNDGKGKLYHFNGLEAGGGWANLALVLRASTDNGATWSAPRLVNSEHDRRNQVISGTSMTADGALIQPCDAAYSGNGGTAIHISSDVGETWVEPGAETPKPSFVEDGRGGTIAGIHAGVVELKDGRLLAFGRGDTIEGRMPESISDDGGKTWHYGASPFPPISSGQRLVFMRLRDDSLLFASFTGVAGRYGQEEGMIFTDSEGGEFRGHGLFAALSHDEGESWPVRKLLTPGKGEFDSGGGRRHFVADAGHAEPGGYLAATQAPNGMIQLISSGLHYRFNTAWLKERPTPAD